jgi:hypothetical protein
VACRAGRRLSVVLRSLARCVQLHPTVGRVTLAVVVGAMGVAAAWSWHLVRRLAVFASRRLATPGPEHAPIRRSYVFGAIGRQAFDAAMKKARKRRPRRRAS